MHEPYLVDLQTLMACRNLRGTPG